MPRPETIPIRPNLDFTIPLPDQDYWYRVYRWDYRYYALGLPYTQEIPPDYDLRQLIAHYGAGVSTPRHCSSCRAPWSATRDAELARRARRRGRRQARPHRARVGSEDRLDELRERAPQRRLSVAASPPG